MVLSDEAVVIVGLDLLFNVLLMMGAVVTSMIIKKSLMF